jgi:hypothetical protein
MIELDALLPASAAGTLSSPLRGLVLAISLTDYQRTRNEDASNNVVQQAP